MSNTHKSSSDVQVKVERYIFNLLEDKLGFSLDANRKLYLKDNPFTFIQPDFYSEEKQIIGEIFAHIGTIKVGQKHKFTNDILKLLTFEKAKKLNYRKILVVCDDDVVRYLQGDSVLAERIRLFNMEIMLIELSDELKKEVIETQRRQKMVNV